MAILVTVLAVVVALLALLVAGLLRSHAEIIRALHELGADREARADRDLGRAGIHPSHPSLYPRAVDDLHRGDSP
ncbi:MAG: hypothetical protein ACRDZ1_06105 [Acidimicrobiia bacterium]